MIGRTIGKYRIINQLGRGGMGTVYTAVDETLDREVAVKVLNPELTDTDVMRRFRAEATILAKLNHHEIATIFEIYRSDSDLLMVMELVRGETLDQLSQRCGPLPPERAAYLVAQVLGALEHAHRAGIVHRDLKPANVMVTDTGGIKIMDFGIARVAGAEHLTSDGHMMGTPAYMAPEQVMAKEVDCRADLYSCGVVFYRLLTGNLPFEADTAIGMVQKALAEAPTPISRYRTNVPPWCQIVLDKALAKSPADRYQTAEEFRMALTGAIGSWATEHTGMYAAAHGLSASMPAGGAAVVGATPIGSLQPTGPLLAPQPAGAPAAGAGGGGKPAADATIVLQKSHFAMAGILLAIVAVGVAVLAIIALRRPAETANPPAASAVTASAPETPPTPVAAPAEAPAPVPPPAAAAPAPKPEQQAVAAAKAPAAAAPATGGSPAAAARAKEPSAKPAGDSAAAKKPAGAGTVASVAPAEVAPFVFQAKAVVVEGGKNREHDASVSMADGKMTVTEKGDKVVATVPYAALVGLDYSNSRQPLWNSPEGPAEAIKVEGGAFGFLKGGRHWLVLRTKDQSVVLRVGEESVRNVIAGIEERTGQKIARVAPRKD